MPMERAVPLMLFTADSTETVFRSGIFCLAISRTWASLTLPTLSLFGVPEPLARFAAFFSRTAAGGDLVPKGKARSTWKEEGRHILVLRARVELLAEFHDVDLGLT